MSRVPLEDVTEKLLTSYHESGHCIGHLVMGWPFRLASIVVDNDCLGRVEEQDGIPKPSAALQAVVLLAGTLSVDYLLGSPCGWVHRQSQDVPDWAEARLAIKNEYFPSEPLTTDERIALDKLAAKVGAHKLTQVAAVVFARVNCAQAAVVERELPRWVRTAWRLVNRYWPAIQAVASALMARKVLTYAEVVEVYSGQRVGVSCEAFAEFPRPAVIA